MNKDDAELFAVAISNQIFIMKAIAVLLNNAGLDTEATEILMRAGNVRPLIRGEK